MKRLDHILYVFLLLAVAACTENDGAVVDDMVMQSFTATLGQSTEDVTRTQFIPGFEGANKGKLLLSWEEEERITLLTTNAEQTVIGRTFDLAGTSANGVSCSFSGPIVKKAEMDKYSYFYPCVTPTYTDDFNLAGGDFTIDFSQQFQYGNATTAHLKKYYPLYWSDPENQTTPVPYAAVFHIGVDLPNKGSLIKVVIRQKEGTNTLANNFRFSTKKNSTTGPITLHVSSDMQATRWDVYIVVGPCKAKNMEMLFYTKENGEDAPYGPYDIVSNRQDENIEFLAGKVYHYNSTEMMPDVREIQWKDLGLYEKMDADGKWVITTADDPEATHKAYIADRNVGAAYVYEPGYLFAWGDYTPKIVSTMSNYTYAYWNSSENRYKYLPLPDYICGDINYDPATYWLGPEYRMMTKEEADFLSDTGVNTAVTFPEDEMGGSLADHIPYYDSDGQPHYQNYYYKPLIINSTGEEIRFYMNGFAAEDGYNSYDHSMTWIGEQYSYLGYDVQTSAYLFQVNLSKTGNSNDPSGFMSHTALGPEERRVAAPIRAVKMVPIDSE